MDKKEKINLLSNLQNALDSKELEESIKKSQSGDYIYALFVEAINKNLDTLLSDGKKLNNDVSLESTDFLLQKINYISESKLVTLLVSLSNRLNSADSNNVQPQSAMPAHRTSNNIGESNRFDDLARLGLT